MTNATKQRQQQSAALADDAQQERTEDDGAAPVRERRNSIRNLREHILNVDDRTSEDTYVEEWGVWIRVMSLSAADRAKFQRQVTKQQGGVATINWDRFWPDLVILAAYDPDDGARIFESADRDALLPKNAKCLEEVAAVARRLSGLDENAFADAKSETEDD